MTHRERQIIVGPLPLHRTQREALESTAQDLQRMNPSVPSVSQAWVLRELCTWGVPELLRIADQPEPVTLRAPSPTRGAPPSLDPSEARAAIRSRGDYEAIAPFPLPSELIRQLRALASRIAKTGVRKPPLAGLLRESILLGFELRERARQQQLESEQQLRDMLRQQGHPLAAEVRVALGFVVTHYTPPGRRKDGSSAWEGHPCFTEDSPARALKLKPQK